MANTPSGSGIIKWEIERKRVQVQGAPPAAGPETQIITVDNNPQFDQMPTKGFGDTVVVGQKYMYRIRAVNSVGAGPWSNWAEIEAAARPGTPTNVPPGPQTGAPQVTSPGVATATQGVQFNFTISATNPPVIFEAVNLPNGLILTPGTGVISGIPVKRGVFVVIITARNRLGGTQSRLAITVKMKPATRKKVKKIKRRLKRRTRRDIRAQKREKTILSKLLDQEKKLLNSMQGRPNTKTILNTANDISKTISTAEKKFRRGQKAATNEYLVIQELKELFDVEVELKDELKDEKTGKVMDFEIFRKSLIVKHNEIATNITAISNEFKAVNDGLASLKRRTIDLKTAQAILAGPLQRTQQLISTTANAVRKEEELVGYLNALELTFYNLITKLDKED